MRKVLLRAGVVVAVFGVSWGSYAAYRAHQNLVTLDVRDADLRAVVRSIMWQTWERILVHREVNGKVTLNVQSVPLERVMQILSEQTSSRWMAVYPLYSSRKSLTALQNLTLGKDKADTNGWSAFQPRGPRLGGGGGPGGGVFGANLRAQNQLVSMKALNKDVTVVAVGLERYAQAQVVPEDGTKGIVYLNISNGTMPQAVRQLANQVDRHWTRFYAFEPGFRFRGPPDGSTNDDTFARRDGPPPEFTQRMDEQFQAQLETMSPEEQKQAQERRQRWQEMRNLTPEQRRERMAQLMADPAMQQQMIQSMNQRFKDSTPQQRADRANERWARRAARMAAASGGAAPSSGGTSGGRGSSAGGSTPSGGSTGSSGSSGGAK